MLRSIGKGLAQSAPGTLGFAMTFKIHQAAQKAGGTYASVIRAIIKSDLVQKTQTEPDDEK